MLFTGVLSAEAQVTLNDKDSLKVDLGFGIKQKEALSTAAYSIISGEELQQTSAISLMDALYGRILGLSAYKNGGFAGDESGIGLNIRGYQTAGDNGLLILVDGYERPINRLTVEEVESVTVLRDAAAVAMYGHEGVNGILLVKTKRGTEAKTHVKAGYSHKFNFGAEYAEMLDGYNYAAALNKARINDGLGATYTQQELDLFKSGTDPFFYPNVDWRDLAFKNSASEDRANLSVYGGSDKIQYYTMLDYTSALGLLKGTEQSEYSSQLKYSKANIRSNVDFELSPTTKMSVDIMGIFLETNQPAFDNANAISWYLYKTPASAFPYQTSSGIWGGNEAYGESNVIAKIQDVGFSKTHQRQLWANAKITQDLGFWVKGLSLSLGGGYDNASITYEQRSKGYQYGYEYYKGNIGDKNNVQEVIMGNKVDNLSFTRNVASQWRIMQSFVGVHYNTSFSSDDNLSTSVVYTTKNEVRDAQSNTFNRANVMGVVHYDHSNKYIADLVLAANGSNRSYPAKWAFSPTLSLGYVYADNPGEILSYGKVRGSAGIQHSDYVPAAGIWLSRWNSSNGQFFYGQGFSNSWGSFITEFPTTDFSQEKASKLNLGTNIRLWDMIDFTLDGYYQMRSHILLDATRKNSYVAGIPSAWDDVGKVKSYGVEVGARFAKKIGNDLYVNASAMMTWGKNEIVEWIESPAYPNLSRIGTGVNEPIVMQATGFFKDQNDIDNSLRQEFSEVRPGDTKYKDVNGDGVISVNDAIALGCEMGIPKLNYAFNLGMEYKGFGFNAWFQGTGDYMKNFMAVDGVWGVISDNRNLSKDYYNNSWDVLGDAARYPRFTTQTVINNQVSSTVWLQKVHFLKLRDCELYYKLPQSIFRKYNISGVKVFVQGQNLLSFDNVDAMDAEVLSTAYPVMKAINVGLHITF